MVFYYAFLFFKFLFAATGKLRSGEFALSCCGPMDPDGFANNRQLYGFFH